MTPTEIITATNITAVWIALGGDLPEHGRARAFYRNGDNKHAVSINDEKACWFDHRDNIGGGMLDLIQHVLRCDRRGALSWLSNFTGLPLGGRPQTAAHRARTARARNEGMELVKWRKCITASLKEQLAHWWRVYHETLRYILKYGLDSEKGCVFANLHECAEAEIDRLRKQLDNFTALSFSDLVPTFRDQTRRKTA
jgi:hypothetical protein